VAEYLTIVDLPVQIGTGLANMRLWPYYRLTRGMVGVSLPHREVIMSKITLMLKTRNNFEKLNGGEAEEF
jgi:hypothetical protein